MAVIFDVDGTLLDTYSLVSNSFKDVFENHLSHIEYNEEMLKSFFGPPLIETFYKLTNDLDYSKELILHYRRYHDINQKTYLKVFPGIIEMIEELHRQGIKLGVLSNKMRHVILAGFSEVGIPNYFSEVIGVEGVAKPKPDPEGLTFFKNLFKEELIMVGDSVIDIQTAINARIKSVGVTWGLIGAKELKEAKATFVVDSVSELKDLLLSLQK